MYRMLVDLERIHLKILSLSCKLNNFRYGYNKGKGTRGLYRAH